MYASRTTYKMAAANFHSIAIAPYDPANTAHEPTVVITSVRRGPTHVSSLPYTYSSTITPTGVAAIT